MKTQIIPCLLLAVLAFLGCAATAAPMGSAFTYQGRLMDGGVPASGTFDLKFSLFEADSGGGSVGGPVTNLATEVVNGLFTVTLDFGDDAFTGNARWLEIAVRTNGPGLFAILAPRQPCTPTPYALHAGEVNATGISGPIPASNIGSGTITSNMLAPGAAAANIIASGQSAVGSGGVVLSSSQSATNLLALGYSRFGGPLELSWQNIASIHNRSSRVAHTQQFGLEAR